MSLLDAALAALPKPRKRRPADEDELELALAYFSGRITGDAASAALGGTRSSAIYRLHAVIRNAVIGGRLQLSRVTP